MSETNDLMKEETIVIKINPDTLEYSADLEMCNREHLIMALKDILSKLEVMDLGPDAEVINAVEFN